VAGRSAEAGGGRRWPRSAKLTIAFGLSIMLVGLAAALQVGLVFAGALVMVVVFAYFVWT
jgi:hypothetical protein